MNHRRVMKQELLESGAIAELTAGLDCATTPAALGALWAEVRRCHAGGPAGSPLDYEACLAALGGQTWADAEAEADAFSEFSLAAALSGGSSEVEAEHAVRRASFAAQGAGNAE